MGWAGGEEERGVGEEKESWGGKGGREGAGVEDEYETDHVQHQGAIGRAPDFGWDVPVAGLVLLGVRWDVLDEGEAGRSKR